MVVHKRNVTIIIPYWLIEQFNNPPEPWKITPILVRSTVITHDLVKELIKAGKFGEFVESSTIRR